MDSPMTPPTPDSDVAKRLVADWRLRKFAGIMPASAEDDLTRRISAALAAQQAEIAQLTELSARLFDERDAATDSTTQCLYEIERLAKALGAETERCAKKIESFMTPESGPNYGLMGDAARAAVRR